MIAREWYARGVPPDGVAYLAFTVAAAEEAARRIGGEKLSADEFKEQFPLFRTIHSLAYSGLMKARAGAAVMKPADMKRFAKETGYEGKYSTTDWEDLPSGVAFGTHWDKAHVAYQIGRMTAGNKSDLDAVRREMARKAIPTVGFLAGDVYQTFVKRYEEFKAREGLVDFTDMLEFALTEMDPVEGCRYVVVDEAQDLGPIMYGIVDRLFRLADEVIWVGDPDQAIYSFAGASASLLLDRAKRADWRILLRQTHRFGQEIADFSARIIARCTERLDAKEVVGLPSRNGQATIRPWTPELGHRFILHRHVAGCREIARAFIEAGLPFRNERGKDPLSVVARVKAWKALDILSKGGKVPFGQVKLVVEELLPSMAPVDEKIRLVVHGAKKRLDGAKGDDSSLADLTGKILTEEGARTVKNRNYEWMHHRDDLWYYDRVIRNGYSLEARWPIVTTIHASKGRQAPHVVVFAETSRRCWDDADGEHRLAYVAATRTEGNLDIVVERKVKWADSPYAYPVEG
jgi:superfamily I DNA/RNA helicase